MTEPIPENIRADVLEVLGHCYLTQNFLEGAYLEDETFRANVHQGLEMSLRLVGKAFESHGYTADQDIEQERIGVWSEVNGLWRFYRNLLDYCDMDIIDKQRFAKTLDSLEELSGIRSAAKVGMPFDPNYHHAVRMCPGKEDTIMNVIYPGFVARPDVLLYESVVWVGNGQAEQDKLNPV